MNKILFLLIFVVLALSYTRQVPPQEIINPVIELLKMGSWFTLLQMIGRWIGSVL